MGRFVKGDVGVAPPGANGSERLVLERSPQFQALLAQSRRSIQEGKGLAEEDFWVAVNERYSGEAGDGIRLESEGKHERVSR